MQAQLRGALRGALAPVSVPSLVRELGLEGLGSLQSLLPSLVEQLLAEGGRCLGAGWWSGGFMCVWMDACEGGLWGRSSAPSLLLHFLAFLIDD